MKKHKKSLLAAALLGAAALAPQLAWADGTIKVGLLATLEGPFTVLGQDGVRGAELALNEAGYMAGGKKIEVIKGSSDASPGQRRQGGAQAGRAGRRRDPDRAAVGRRRPRGQGLREDAAEGDLRQRHVRGAGHDACAIPRRISSASPPTARNGWRGSATMPTTSRNTRRWSTIAEDYSFPYTQVFGFMAGFCKAGGHVPKKFWVPIGNKDFSSVIAAIPDKVDAIYVALGGADGVNFLTQYQQAGGTAPLIGGSITVDQTVLGTKGKQRDYVVGTPAAGPIADNSDEPAWKKFVADYKAAYKDGFPSPSLFAQGYYINTKAVLLALDKVGGDLSDEEAKFRDVLASSSSTRRPAWSSSTRTGRRSPTII